MRRMEEMREMRWDGRPWTLNNHPFLDHPDRVYTNTLDAHGCGFSLFHYGSSPATRLQQRSENASRGAWADSHIGGKTALSTDAVVSCTRPAWASPESERRTKDRATTWSTAARGQSTPLIRQPIRLIPRDGANASRRPARPRIFSLTQSVHLPVGSGPPGRIAKPSTCCIQVLYAIPVDAENNSWVISSCSCTWLCAMWTVDCGLWTVGCGLWTVDCNYVVEVVGYHCLCVLLCLD